MCIAEIETETETENDREQKNRMHTVTIVLVCGHLCTKVEWKRRNATCGEKTGDTVTRKDGP